MDQARLTREIFEWKPMGTRPVGRLRQRWQQDAMEDFKKLKVKTGRKELRIEELWRDLSEKAKTHRVVLVVPINGDDFLNK
jgi:hypothetical protein